MINKVNRDPYLMEKFAYDLETYSTEIYTICKEILAETANARSSKIFSDNFSLMYLDSLDEVILQILEGARDNIGIACKINKSAERLLMAIEEGGKIRGR